MAGAVNWGSPVTLRPPWLCHRVRVLLIWVTGTSQFPVTFGREGGTERGR